MTNGNDTAYPQTFDTPILEKICKGFNDNGKNFEVGGLTKREYFAAMAMNGLCANGILKPNEVAEIVERSAMLADGLINQLNK